MDLKSISILPPKSVFGLAAFDLRFYVGCQELKVKAVDKTTGAGFTVAYLCPTQGGDPIKGELARDFAAMACAAPAMLTALEGMLADYLVMTNGNGDKNTEAARAAIALARRATPTIGLISPEITKALTGVNPEE